MSKYILFILFLFFYVDASSQITGISREQKIEIVSTLETYPIVLRELDLHYELLIKCEQINDLNVAQIKTLDEQISKQQSIIDNKDEQIDLLRTQLKKKKSGWFIPLLIGIGGGVVLGVSM